MIDQKGLPKMGPHEPADSDLSVGTTKDGRCAVSLTVRKVLSGLQQAYEAREEFTFDESDVRFLHTELGLWLERRRRTTS